MKGCQKKCYNLIFKIKVVKAIFTKNKLFDKDENAVQHSTQSHTTPLQRYIARSSLSLSLVCGLQKLIICGFVRSSLVGLSTRFLAIEFFTLLKSLNFSNFSILFAHFSLSVRRKFINFA